MVAPDQPATAVTVDEFEAFIARPENRDRVFELINGEIVEKMPTQEHGIIAGIFTGEFYIYLKQHPIGYVCVETRYRPPEDPKNDRLPDVSISLSPTIVRKGPVLGMPDIAIEIQSPDDDPRDLIEKAYFYLDHGTKIVIVVLTAQRQVLRIAEGELIGLNEDDTLDLGEVLPGFTLPVGNIFPPVQK